jgi:hypothetical protein
VLALVINIAIVAYLLIAKRLFGLRGGGRAEQAEHAADTGWAPIERATPGSAPPPAHAPSPRGPARPPASPAGPHSIPPAAAKPR